MKHFRSGFKHQPPLWCKCHSDGGSTVEKLFLIREAKQKQTNGKTKKERATKSCRNPEKKKQQLTSSLLRRIRESQRGEQGRETGLKRVRTKPGSSSQSTEGCGDERRKREAAEGDARGGSPGGCGAAALVPSNHLH